MHPMAMTPEERAAKKAATVERRKLQTRASCKKQRDKKKQLTARTAADPGVAGPAPMSRLDYDFCAEYVKVGKQEAAYRNVCPEAKWPGEAAMALMKRVEIREHIKAIFLEISKRRERAAIITARSSLLTLEVADDRLLEIVEQRRRTRGEMLTRDVKQLLVEGATPVTDENGKVVDYQLTPELKASLLNEGAPVEDADLLKAIKLVYDRKQGIVKPEKPPEVTFVGTMLYKPKWYQAGPPAPRTIEGTV